MNTTVGPAGSASREPRLTPLRVNRALSALACKFVILGMAGCAITPEPITLDERAAQIAADRASMWQGQEPLAGAIDLPTAMARTIKYNLGHRLKVMDEALAKRQLGAAKLELLPRLDLEADYRGRNSQNASSSLSVLTGRQSLEPSTSQDRSLKTGELRLAWNVLDFGISYFKAQQEADRTLIAGHKRRKVVHDLMRDVRDAYWRAVVAQYLAPRVMAVREKAANALADSRTAEDQRLALMATLRYQRSLLGVISGLESLSSELAKARPALATLMNLPVGTTFELALPDMQALTVPVLSDNVAPLEMLALARRPELLEAAYESRIGDLETKKAMARLLPGLEIDFSGRSASNSFLAEQAWYETGLRVTWNLLSLPARLEGVEFAELQQDFARQQRLAISMAVLSQVHLSHLDYRTALRKYTLASDLASVEARIAESTAAAAAARAQSPLEVIRAETNAMFAEVQLFDSYSSVQAAAGRIHATLGLDPLPDTIASHSVEALADAIAETLARWDNGDFVPATAPGEAKLGAPVAAL